MFLLCSRGTAGCCESAHPPNAPFLWLHYPHFYLTDGTPVEGLSYSYLSIEDTADLVVRSSTIPNPQDLLPSLTCT